MALSPGGTRKCRDQKWRRRTDSSGLCNAALHNRFRQESCANNRIAEQVLRGGHTRRTDAAFLFDTPTDSFWREVLKKMGGQFRAIAHYPTDPRLN